MYIFWANGRTAASLAPAFHLRGAVAAQRPGTPRRGRRSKESGGSEIALPEVRERLIAGCKRFYRPGRYTMAEAYVETLETYFKAEIRSLHGGSLQTAQLPVPFLPTERQFRYICGLEDRRLGKRLKKPRKARAEAVKEVRRGRARDGVDGPGHRFEIDATGLQIQLVSYWDPLKLVGEPWLYLVIDVWSGLIAGYVLSLEDPCWELSLKALRSCCSDKAAVYESVQLPPGEWPCHHLPRGLTSDNAELLGLKAEQIQRMGITDEFSPGYRPKAKGTIESTFGRIKQDIFSKLPGAHPKNPGRRESDGKKGAALNIRQLERITVIAITKYNRAKIDSKIIPLDARAADLPKMSRNALYAWGLKNRFGFTLKLDPLEIPEYLMTRGEATVADGGFRFKGQIYISERAVPGNYRVLEGSGARKVDIRYDGHNASEILFYDVGRNGWAAARHENEHIRNLMPTFNELKVHKDEFKKLGTHTRYAEISKSSEERKEIIDPMCRDSNRVKAALKGTPKSGKEEIRSNRRTEKAGLRQLNSRKSKTEKVEAPHAGHTDASPESDEVEQMVADAVDASWEESDG